MDRRLDNLQQICRDLSDRYGPDDALVCELKNELDLQRSRSRNSLKDAAPARPAYDFSGASMRRYRATARLEADDAPS
jgi:hypothetical protein